MLTEKTAAVLKAGGVKLRQYAPVSNLASPGDGCLLIGVDSRGMGLCIWTKTIKDCVYNCTLNIERLRVQLSFLMV